MDDLVRRTFREIHCDQDGTQRHPVNFATFRHKMYKAHPKSKTEMKPALKKQVPLSLW